VTWEGRRGDVKIVVEKHPDTYVAYPLDMEGIVVGEGESPEAALADLKSALRFHVEVFGADALDGDPAILEVVSPEIGLLSEPALGEDWNRPEEDIAWMHLQGARQTASGSGLRKYRPRR
jgi:predicted RNase H-like HicB family nuclease